MKVKHEYERMPANEVWNVVVAYINKNKQFLSSTGIKYNAKVIIDSIEYKGGREGSDRATEGESISKNQFISAFRQARDMECINTKKCQGIY